MHCRQVLGSGIQNYVQIGKKKNPTTTNKNPHFLKSRNKISISMIFWPNNCSKTYLWLYAWTETPVQLNKRYWSLLLLLEKIWKYWELIFSIRAAKKYLLPLSHFSKLSFLLIIFKYSSAIIEQSAKDFRWEKLKLSNRPQQNTCIWCDCSSCGTWTTLVLY